MDIGLPDYPFHVIRSSYGNDSVALIQWAHEQKLDRVFVHYSDTGWAKSDWDARVAKLEVWVRSLGFRPCRTQSMGLADLVKQRKGWPRQGIQFCTQELKIAPGNAWLDTIDPIGMAICMVGVRREESFNRREYPEYESISEIDGGRAKWAPLVKYTTAQRDALLARAGIEPLAASLYGMLPLHQFESKRPASIG